MKEGTEMKGGGKFEYWDYSGRRERDYNDRNLRVVYLNF
jgi:hypothetical protein